MSAVSRSSRVTSNNSAMSVSRRAGRAGYKMRDPKKSERVLEDVHIKGIVFVEQLGVWQSLAWIKIRQSSTGLM